MDTGALLINQNKVSGCLQILEYDVEVIDKLALGDQLDPLNQDVNVPPLKEYVVPFRLLNHVKDKAHVKLLVFWSLVVFLNLAEHADDGEQSVLLEL